MVDFFVGFSGDVSDTLWCHFRHALVSFQTRPPFRVPTLSTISWAKKMTTIVTKVTIVKKGT